MQHFKIRRADHTHLHAVRWHNIDFGARLVSTQHIHVDLGLIIWEPASGCVPTIYCALLHTSALA